MKINDQLYNHDQASVDDMICNQKGDCYRTSISRVCHVSKRLIPSGETNTWHVLITVCCRGSGCIVCWVNSKQSSIWFKVHVSTSPPDGSLATRRLRKATYFHQVKSLDCLDRNQGLSNKTQLRLDAVNPLWSRTQDRETSQVVRRLAN